VSGWKRGEVARNFSNFPKYFYIESRKCAVSVPSRVALRIHTCQLIKLLNYLPRMKKNGGIISPSKRNNIHPLVGKKEMERSNKTLMKVAFEKFIRNFFKISFAC
jgi:hypothetical protein